MPESARANKVLIRHFALRGMVCAALFLSGCSAPAPPPRLAVVIVVDMFPAQGLERFAEHFTERGFKRLMREGAWFTNAHYSYGITSTGPGHATLATGTVPAEHGIVGNRWFEVGSVQPVGCVADDQVSITGSAHVAVLTPASPRRLMASTVSDRLKEHYGPAAKVWSGALKDRSAILSAGHHPDGVVWWTAQSGEFISSSAYFSQLPGWCEELNGNHFADSFFDVTWDYLLPLEAYAGCDEDDVPYELGSQVLWTNTMPHGLGKSIPAPHPLYYNRLRASPFGNELVLEWARRAVVNESLGADDVPDLLIVGLSSPDVCGHVFGVNSHEMLDMMVRTDRQLADWLDYLDEKVGLSHCRIVLTGDHGACSTPEYLAKQGHDAGRVDITDVFYKCDGALREKYGELEEGVYYLTATDFPWIFLNETTLNNKSVSVDEAAELVARVAGAYPGIEAAYVTSKLAGRPVASLTAVERAVVNSTFPGRSGHVYVHLKRNWAKKGTCGDHGSAHDYDTHVPLVFWGKSFRAGKYDQPVRLCDVGPTLCKVLGIAPPTAPKPDPSRAVDAARTGTVLRQALK